MTYRRSFALAFVAFSAACGSSGTGGETLEAGNEQPGFNEPAPSNGTEQPTNSYDGTPNNTEQPAFNPNAPATDPQIACERACSAFIQAGCVEDEPEECVGDCRESLDEAEQCADEFVAVLECVVNLPQFVCENGEPELDDEELLVACGSQYQQYFRCFGLDQGPEPDPVPACTIDGGCECGGDPCITCLCFFDQNLDACSVECGL